MDAGCQRVNRWIRDQIFRDRAGGRVVRFELRHLPVGGKLGQELLSVEVPEELSDNWCEDKSSEIYGEAGNDALGIEQGVQRYVLLVYRADEPDTLRGRLAFTIAGPDRVETDGFISETPDKQGLTTMLMRHLESTEKTYAGVTGTLMGIMQRMTVALAEENTSLRAKQLESIEATESMLSMQQERQLAVSKAESHTRMIEDMLKEVKLLAPAVVNRLTGRQMLPESQSPKEVMATKFAETLSDEQKLSIASQLTPTQQIALAELFRRPDSH